jgi:catechol 2,3-dioxygenase-like lactoylglutathione lyase family enzyme
MQLETLAVTSRDLARSRAFYAGKLGFHVVDERGGQWFVIDVGGLKLTIDTDGARSPLTQAEPRLVFKTHELAARCTQLRDAGVSVDGPHGGRALLTDPDGHPIVLIQSQSQESTCRES